MYFYSIHSLAIKAPYVLYFVMVKYGLLFRRWIGGENNDFERARASAFFSGCEFAYADYMQKAGDAHGASRLSGIMFAYANI